MKKQTILLILALFVIILPQCEWDWSSWFKSTTNFVDCNVWPQYRCPDEDIRASWETRPNSDVTISYQGKSITIGKNDPKNWVLSAANANQLPKDFKVTFQAGKGEKRTFEIHTIHGTENYDRTGLQISPGMHKYKIELLPEIWDDDLVVSKIKLVLPKTYRCNNDSENTNYEWQYDKGTSVSGYLKIDNGFEQTFSPEPKVEGTWYFTIPVPENDKTCPGWNLMGHAPKIIFTVYCKQNAPPIVN